MRAAWTKGVEGLRSACVLTQSTLSVVQHVHLVSSTPVFKKQDRAWSVSN